MNSNNCVRVIVIDVSVIAIVIFVAAIVLRVVVIVVGVIVITPFVVNVHMCRNRRRAFIIVIGVPLIVAHTLLS